MGHGKGSFQQLDTQLFIHSFIHSPTGPCCALPPFKAFIVMLKLSFSRSFSPFQFLFLPFYFPSYFLFIFLCEISFLPPSLEDMGMFHKFILFVTSASRCSLDHCFTFPTRHCSLCFSSLPSAFSCCGSALCASPPAQDGPCCPG